MFLGTLKEVMNLNEDGVTARRRKAINVARKDPDTKVGVQFDGSDADFYAKLHPLLKPKERNKVDEIVKNNSKYFPNEFNDQNRNPVAAYNHGYGVYAVKNNSKVPFLINRRGNINYKHPIMKHEIQHDIQIQAINSIAKQYDRKANQHQDQINKTISNYKKNISSDETRAYNRNPMEFEANMAGINGNPKPTMSTIRIARNALGKYTPKQEFLPSSPHGEYIVSKLENNPDTLKERQDNNNQDKVLQKLDRKPMPGQPNMDKDKYNNRAKQTIKSVHVPSKSFELHQLDSIKGMSRYPEVNKSKNFNKTKSI